MHNKQNLFFPSLILIVQNMSIFFFDIFHAIMSIQFVCLVLYGIYMPFCFDKVNINRKIVYWTAYVGMVAFNYLIGGDANFILSFIVCNLSMLLMLRIHNLAKVEYSIIKLCTFVHLCASLAVYFLPQGIIDSTFLPLLGDNFASNYSWRVVKSNNPGLTTQPGVNAFYLALFVFVCITEIFEGGKKKLLYVALLFVSMLMILTTAKRSALTLTVIVPILFYTKFLKGHTIQTMKKLSTTKIACGFVFIALCFIYYVSIHPEFLMNLMEKEETLSSSKDISNGRYDLWDIAYQGFLSSPLYGIGLKQIYNQTGYDVHNTYIQILAETGIMGFSAFLFSLACVFKQSVYNVKKYIRVCTDSKDIKTISLGFMIFLFLIIYGFVGNTFIDYLPFMLFNMSVFMINLKRY